MPSRGSAPSLGEGLGWVAHGCEALPEAQGSPAQQRASWWSYGFSVLDCSKQAPDQRVQLLLLVRAERGVQHSRHLGRIRRAGLSKHQLARFCEGDPAGAAVVGVEFAADQPGSLN